MIASNNLKGTAYEHVKKMILNNELEEGCVYSERKICSDIGVSRTPFHSALQQLESEGYIDILPSRGFALHQMSEQDIEETFEIRSAIEFFCIYTMTEDYRNKAQKSMETIDELEFLLEKQKKICETTADIKEFVKYDFKFHETIVAYNQNATFNAIYKTHTYKIQNLACKSLAHEGRMKNTIEEHQAILSAVMRDDSADLCEITMRHFNTPKYINLQDI